MGKIFAEEVRTLAALRLSEEPTCHLPGHPARVARLSARILDTIEEWCENEREASGDDVTDTTGRPIAPPQTAPAPRPPGVWDGNCDSREPVK